MARKAYRLLLLPLLILPALAANGPPSDERSHVCSRIQLNHVIDPESGVHVVDQLLFEDWSYADDSHHIEGWVLAKDGRPLVQRHGDGWRVRWHSQYASVAVTARHYTETWTDHDPEVLSRSADSGHQRRLRNLAGYRVICLP